MKTVSGEPGGSGAPRPQAGGSWPLSRWLLLILLVLIAHVALIYIFGARKPIPPMAVKNAPRLELAAGSSEWLVLNDPTLFALPNIKGFSSAWLKPPPLHIPQLEWTEPPRWLQLPAGELGAVFRRFMETNRFATLKFEFRPPPRFAVPLVPLEPKFAETSTLRIEGDIARRPLLTHLDLPSWPFADVIAPSIVQVLVNAAGEVVSAVLLPSNNSGEVHDADADQRALDLARAARFAPASDLTFGKLIFNWRTIAPPATNAPAGL
jgi:hypothetical protein